MSIGRNRPRQIVDCPILQWANGRTEARDAGSNGRFTPLVGFHLECGRDEALDAALHALSFARVEIKHRRQTGPAVIVPHWFLGERAAFHPVTAGPPAPTVAGLLHASGETAEAGLGVAWPDGERSRLAVRGYVAELFAAGYDGPVQLTTRSRMTDKLLAALVDHVRACEAADALVDRARHPHPVDLHEVALPLGAGPEESFGKGDSTEVFPLVSEHPDVIDAGYLRGRWRPDAVNAAALRDWPAIVTWARGFAADAAPRQAEDE